MIDLPYLWSASTSFPSDRIEKMAEAGILKVRDGHFLYPADERGMHLTRFFSVRPFARFPEFADWVADDILTWAESEAIGADGLLAPDQEGAKTLAEVVSDRLGINLVLWRTLPSGRFAEPTGGPEDFTEGRIEKGMRIIPFNGATLQGRCVGQRLQDFCKAHGGEVAGLAVFAKGTTGIVEELENKWGAKFYATIQVDVPVYSPEQCPLEKLGRIPPLVPWTEING